GGGDHLDVDPGVEERAEELGRHTRVGAHASPDEGELADLVVVAQVGEAEVGGGGAQRGERRLAVGLRQGEGDVGEAGRLGGHVLDDHVDVRAGLGDHREEAGGRARDVGDADDGDLALAAVVGDTGDDRLFHAA